MFDGVHLEDPCTWRDTDGYHMLIKDFDGEIADQPGEGIYSHSYDAVEWTAELGSTYTLRFAGRRKITAGRAPGATAGSHGGG